MPKQKIKQRCVEDMKAIRKFNERTQISAHEVEARLMKSGIEYETDHDHISTCHKTFLYTVHNKHGNYYICSFCGHACDIFIRN